MRKSSGLNDGDVLGVVSTQPGIVLDDVFDPTQGLNKLTGYQDRLPVAVALAGRIPVNVSTENGPIHAGDYLTTSSIPGVAMKATKAGKIIGQALFGYDKTEIGAVMMFVNNSFYGGQSLSEIFPGISEAAGPNDYSAQVLAGMVSGLNQPAVTDLSELYTDRLAAAVEIITPRITADEITARSIKADRIEGIEILAGRISDLESTATGKELISISDVNPEFESAKVNLDLTVDGAISASGLKVMGPAEFAGETMFGKLAYFLGNVLFKGDVEFRGRATYNSDAGGMALIKQGDSRVRISFERAYDKPPIISITPLGSFTLFKAENVTPQGFDIVLDAPALTDTEFNWMAAAIISPKVSHSR